MAALVTVATALATGPAGVTGEEDGELSTADGTDVGASGVTSAAVGVGGTETEAPASAWSTAG